MIGLMKLTRRCVIEQDVCGEEMAFQETPNCCWLFRLPWHLWKFYGQQSLQLVTFWIPFKAENVTVFYITGHRTRTGEKKKNLKAWAPRVVGADERLTVIWSWKKRSAGWCILKETKGLSLFETGSFRTFLNNGGGWYDETDVVTTQRCVIFTGEG